MAKKGTMYRRYGVWDKEAEKFVPKNSPRGKELVKEANSKERERVRKGKETLTSNRMKDGSIFSKCHKDRPHYAKGLCQSCYNFKRSNGEVALKAKTNQEELDRLEAEEKAYEKENPKPKYSDKIAKVRTLGDSDLLFFMREILGNKWINEEEHRDLCNFLMEGHANTILPEEKWDFHLKKGQSLYRAVACPRDTLKTTVCSQGYPLWRIARGEHDLTVLLDSEVRDNSKARLVNIESIIKSAWLFKECYGDWDGRKKGYSWNESEMTISLRDNPSIRENTFETAGVDVVKNSKHYFLIIPDDLHSLINSQTSDQIEKVLNHLKDIQPLMSRGGELLLVCTWWADNDANRQFIQKMGKKIKLFQRSTYFDKEETKPRYPNRNPIPYLEEKKISMGMDLFNSQYRLDPVSKENALFLEENLQFVDMDQVPKNLRRFVLCDPAGDQTATTSEKRDSDNWAIGALAVSPSSGIYLMDLAWGKMGETEAIEHMIKFYGMYFPHVTGVEKVGLGNTGQHLRESLRRDGKFAIVEDLKPGGRSKALRISWLEPVIRRRKFYIVKTCPHQESIITEFIRQTRSGNKSGHDDIIDMIAYVQDMIKRYGTALDERDDVGYDDIDERLSGLNQISADHWAAEHRKKNKSRESWIEDFVG